MAIAIFDSKSAIQAFEMTQAHRLNASRQTKAKTAGGFLHRMLFQETEGNAIPSPLPRYF